MIKLIIIVIILLFLFFSIFLLREFSYIDTLCLEIKISKLWYTINSEALKNKCKKITSEIAGDKNTLDDKSMLFYEELYDDCFNHKAIKASRCDY